jgi:hypothetical protein
VAAIVRLGVQAITPERRESTPDWLPESVEKRKKEQRDY